ncbi:MAG: dienelactone hydrolase family protein [Jatrophihabitans sp.]
MTEHRLRVGALAAIAAVALAGCSSSGSAKPAPNTKVNVPTVSQLGPTSFTSAGPFKVGVRTLTLPGPDKTPVEVWFPATAKAVAGTKTVDYNVADYLPKYLQGLFPPNFKGGVYQTDAHRDVPIAAGRFPLVVFTHGYSGFRTQSTFLTTHLASWGFVVAAPELIDNDLTAVIGGSKAPGTSADIAEVKATISLLAKENSATKGDFAGHVDMSHIAAVGHSLGGAVSEGVAASDPRVTTFIGLAGATVGSFGQSSSAATSTVPDKPGMLMVGTRDQVVDPAGMAKAYAAMKAPKRFVTMQGFGHLAFADICQIGGGQGGLTALAKQAGVPLPAQLKKLATDGCEPPATPVTSGWPVIRQAVTAQLRHVFGFDPTTAALTGLKAAFPKVVATESASN